MKYRAEIDGLRALAVLPVIFFHAGFSPFSGGFVGVDVFFVISGYLITTIIINELEQGTFSLIKFYEARARRILPALFLVLLVSIPAAYRLLLPADLKEFTLSLATITLFASNILFWQRTDYWDSSNELNPLVHTWSLAVEEQFYLLFPLLLMFLWGRGRVTSFRVLALIGATSLMLAEWSAKNAPIANYFLVHTRAWELLIGACIAHLHFSSHRGYVEALCSRPVREILASTGLVMIIYSIFAFDENSLFPGVITLIPTIGTALILFAATGGTLVGRILSSKVLVGIGLVSYSSYLWHQPLFAFSRHISSEALGPGQLWCLILATFIIAYLSWRFVEKPFKSGACFGREVVFKSALACSLAFVAVGIAGQKTYGFVDRSKSEISYSALRQKNRNNFGLDLACEGFSVHIINCQTSEEPEILIWGDSYAMHLVPGILASNPRAKIIQLTKSVCGPFFNIAPVIRNHTAEGCLAFNDQVQDWVSRDTGVKYAVLSSPFTFYVEDGKSIVLDSGVVTSSSLEIMDREFRNTLIYLENLGITPVVFSPPPSNGYADIGNCLRRAEYFGNDLNRCNFALSRNSNSLKKVFAWLRSLSNEYNVIFLDELICPEQICLAHDDFTFIYRDHGHLSTSGSSHYGKKFDFYSLIVSR